MILYAVYWVRHAGTDVSRSDERLAEEAAVGQKRHMLRMNHSKLRSARRSMASMISRN